MNVKQIEQEVRDYFGDTSRSPAETKEGLETIAELCEELASTIEDEDGL